MLETSAELLRLSITLDKFFSEHSSFEIMANKTYKIIMKITQGDVFGK